MHYFRFVFGFDHTGTLLWAYSNPRVELVASEDTGAAILAISQTGDLVALDPRPAQCGSQEIVGTRRRCSVRRSMPMAGHRRAQGERPRRSPRWCRSRAITMRASIA